MDKLNEVVANRIIKVIKQCVNPPDEKLEQRNWEKPLTGYLFNFTMVDLIYLLFEIEKEFSIMIPPEAFAEYGFSSIESICKTIQDCV